MRTLSPALACLCLVGCAKNTPGATSPAPVVVVGDSEKQADPKDKPKAAAAKDDPAIARKKALEEAAEFGLIGVLGGPVGKLDLSEGVVGGVIGGSSGFGGLGLKGIGMGGGTGEGIGIGTLGTLGTGSGFGSLGGSSYGRPNERIKAKIEQATIEGPLVPELVQRVLADHREDIQDCYVLEASRGPHPRGRVTVAFTIADTGRVSEVRIPESTLSSRDLTDCVGQVVGTFEFPPPAKGTEVHVLLPVTF